MRVNDNVSMQAAVAPRGVDVLTEGLTRAAHAQVCPLTSEGSLASIMRRQPVEGSESVRRMARTVQQNEECLGVMGALDTLFAASRVGVPLVVDAEEGGSDGVDGVDALGQDDVAPVEGLQLCVVIVLPQAPNHEGGGVPNGRVTLTQRSFPVASAVPIVDADPRVSTVRAPVTERAMSTVSANPHRRLGRIPNEVHDLNDVPDMTDRFAGKLQPDADVEYREDSVHLTPDHDVSRGVDDPLVGHQMPGHQAPDHQAPGHQVPAHQVPGQSVGPNLQAQNTGSGAAAAKAEAHRADARQAATVRAVTAHANANATGNANANGHTPGVLPSDVTQLTYHFKTWGAGEKVEVTMPRDTSGQTVIDMKASSPRVSDALANALPFGDRGPVQNGYVQNRPGGDDEQGREKSPPTIIDDDDMDDYIDETR